MVMCQLSSLCVKVQVVITSTSCAFWDVLLATEEEAVTLTRKTLENKDKFFRTKYMGLRIMVSIYEVPSFLGDANLAAFMLNFGWHRLGMCDEWRFDLILDCKTFYSIPNWFDLEGRRLLVIVFGRKPARWHCSEIGHLSAGKKALKKPDQNPSTFPQVKANDEKEAHVVSPTVSVSAPDRGFIPYFPFIFCGNHRRVKNGMADCGKK